MSWRWAVMNWWWVNNETTLSWQGIDNELTMSWQWVDKNLQWHGELSMSIIMSQNYWKSTQRECAPNVNDRKYLKRQKIKLPVSLCQYKIQDIYWICAKILYKQWQTMTNNVFFLEKMRFNTTSNHCLRNFTRNFNERLCTREPVCSIKFTPFNPF